MGRFLDIKGSFDIFNGGSSDLDYRAVGKFKRQRERERGANVARSGMDVLINPHQPSDTRVNAPKAAPVVSPNS